MSDDDESFGWSVFTGITIVICVVTFVPLLLILVLYMLSYVPPHRPRGLPQNAVFLSAPAISFSSLPRGDWLACQEVSGHNQCTLTETNGNVEFSGEFIAQSHPGSVPESDLLIDVSKTRRDAVWIGQSLVPLVYLKNGEVLIPAGNYEDGKRLYERQKRISSER